MSKQTFTLYITSSISPHDKGKIGVNDFNMARSFGGRPADRILLGTVDVEIEIPEVDTNQAEIEILEKQVQSERAESQSRVNILLDRISKLKAITHEVSE